MTVDSQVSFTVDQREVTVNDDGASLLEVLRDRVGVRSPKDGCSPQGQCGCCTVLVDGAPRVACVTPVKRIDGRAVTTLDGLERADRWAEVFSATGASQCGFCTPGIIVRLDALLVSGVAPGDTEKVERALLAHLCRCTGWRTINDAWSSFSTMSVPPRDAAAAARRAELEGRTPQRVGPDVARGRGGFADDTAPLDALVAVPDGRGGWAIGDTMVEARRAAAKTQGRRTTID
ncbi:MAG TPA: 2Fe-2S iron-sulfur cluster-binding protein, partial [Acidimicrobiales bacterium]|nr:2Fe-2S iron-sulfur cluster-binding protein [Acidimicrobiales bacterium]